MISFMFFEIMYRAPNEISYSDIQFKFPQSFWEDCSSAALMDEPPLEVAITVKF
jgi:hypothetical protein